MCFNFNSCSELFNAICNIFRIGCEYICPIKWTIQSFLPYVWRLNTGDAVLAASPENILIDRKYQL